MDVSKLEAALTPRTRMVVAVSILGNPAALDVMRAFCDRHGLYLFEDNCESLGASLNGKPCGTFGDVNTSAHDHGFFVGNHPRDLTREIAHLREVLDRAAVGAGPADRLRQGFGGQEPGHYESRA